MKVCTECGKELPLAQFNESRPGLPMRRCKACMLRRQRGHRPSRRTTTPHGEAKLPERVKELDAYKSSRGCADCGAREPRLEFDHLADREKLFNISIAVRSHDYPMAEVWAEVAKCEVVCRACHRARTLSRGQYGSPVRDQLIRNASTQYGSEVE